MSFEDKTTQEQLSAAALDSAPEPGAAEATPDIEDAAAAPLPKDELPAADMPAGMSQEESLSEAESDNDTAPHAALPGSSDHTGKKDAPLRSDEPEHSEKPTDMKKPRVSFLHSLATLEPSARARWSGTTSQAYDHAVLRGEGSEHSDYSPKIRRMSDSTRARELRRHRRTGETMPYQKDTPGASTQSMPASKLKKRKKAQNPEESERIPDKLRNNRRHRSTEHNGGIPSAQNGRIQHKRDLSRPDDRAAFRKELDALQNSLGMRVAVLAVLAFLSGCITYIDWIPGFTAPHYLSSSESPLSYLAIQILLGLAAIPFSADVLKRGYMKLMNLHADSDSLAAMTMLSALLSAVMVLPSPDMVRSGVVSVYIAVGLFSLVINAISKRMIVSRALRNFDVLYDGNPKYGIHYIEDEKRAENLTRGTLGDFPILATMQPVKQPEDFLKYTFSTDIGDKFCRTAVPLIFALSAVFSIVMSILRGDAVESGICYGLSIFSLCFSACACTAITLIANLPMSHGTKAYVKNSGLMLGYQSVDDFYDVNCVMLDAQTLFPPGTTKLQSIQVVGESRIEEALQYSASLTQHAGSILKDLFSTAILAEENILPAVEDYSYDEGKGISGWIRNKRVLLGTREMMMEHSIEGLPVSAKEEELVADGNEALYLSVSGTVAAMYIIRLEAHRSIIRWLSHLESENLFLLIRSNDALLSQRGIARMFGFPEDLLKVIPARLEADYAEETQPLQTAKPSMLCAGRLAGFVQTIVGARRIRSAASLGMILQTVTAILGLIYAIVFILLGAYDDLSGAVLLIYHAACTVITLLSVRLKET